MGSRHWETGMRYCDNHQLVLRARTTDKQHMLLCPKSKHNKRDIPIPNSCFVTYQMFSHKLHNKHQCYALHSVVQVDDHVVRMSNVQLQNHYSSQCDTGIWTLNERNPLITSPRWKRHEELTISPEDWELFVDVWSAWRSEIYTDTTTLEYFRIEESIWRITETFHTKF